MRKVTTVYVAVVLSLMITLPGCVSFVEKKDQERLHELEKTTWILLRDVTYDDKTLRKGTRVKILLSMDKSWIKVYAWDVKADPLKSHRFLVLYVFEDEFKKKKYDQKVFIKKFDSYLKAIR